MFNKLKKLLFIKNLIILSLKKLIKFGTLRKELLDFDLKVLAEAIDPDRDLKFKYLGKLHPSL